MPPSLRRFLFETSPWGPFLSAWMVGYCIVDTDGQIYLTDAGAEYLEYADSVLPHQAFIAWS